MNKRCPCFHQPLRLQLRLAVAVGGVAEFSGDPIWAVLGALRDAEKQATAED